MKKIFYGRHEVTQADIDAVTECLQSNYLTQGPMVEQFEVQFKNFVEADYAVACANGTAALHLCALALGVNTNSHVIVTPITFVASANCVTYCGGQVSFCDIDPRTGLMDLEKLRAMIAAKPRGFYTGVVAVHLAGFPIDMEKLHAITSPAGLWIIEDACHAPGAWFTDSSGTIQKCGNGKYADLSAFSFHPVKHLTTGEGGIVTTRKPHLFHRVQKLRTHGITKDPAQMSHSDGPWYYEMQDLGFNYRIPDILCALGLSQLSRLASNVIARQRIAERYDIAFADTPVQPVTPAGTQNLQSQGIHHAHHLYVIRTPNRDGLYEELMRKNIFPQVHYIPVYRQPFYKNLGFATADYPAAEKYYQEALSIPIYPSLQDEEQAHVIDTILEFFN